MVSDLSSETPAPTRRASSLVTLPAVAVTAAGIGKKSTATRRSGAFHRLLETDRQMPALPEPGNRCLFAGRLYLSF
ncbi:MAG: hypothetical protein H6963_06310 [Chromatiaceae bacterium]|nr:hypothetical protein [Chromatiaceae bacterium]